MVSNPTYAIFVKTIPAPASEMDVYFATCHEAARKNVERAFVVLQQHFSVVRYLALTWSEFQMWEVINACESERDAPVDYDQPFDYQDPLAEVEHVPKSSRLSFTCMKKSKMPMFMFNFRRIWLCICERGEEPPTHDLQFNLLYEYSICICVKLY
jgi:hypothetical protein